MSSVALQVGTLNSKYQGVAEMFGSGFGGDYSAIKSVLDTAAYWMEVVMAMVM